MILTVTLNPSMDYVYLVDTFNFGKMTRFPNPSKMVGGKGINSGRVSARLDSDVYLTGFLGGLNGEHILEMLDSEKVFKTIDFLNVDGETRNAITIMHDNNQHTEIVEEGISLKYVDIKKITKYIVRVCKKYPEIDVICLSGSVNTENHKIYSDIIRTIKKELDTNIKILADISGEKLLEVLKGKYKPFFIKPNEHELGELFGVDSVKKESIIDYLKKGLFDNIPLIMVSCGKNGAIVRFDNKFYDLSIPEVNIVNTTGSGDSTVGGLAHALDKNFDIPCALKFSMACGVSNAMNIGVGDVKIEQIMELLPNINISEIE